MIISGRLDRERPRRRPLIIAPTCVRAAEALGRFGGGGQLRQQSRPVHPALISDDIQPWDQPAFENHVSAVVDVAQTAHAADVLLEPATQSRLAIRFQKKIRLEVTNTIELIGLGYGLERGFVRTDSDAFVLVDNAGGVDLV